ncbi:unnamed protein product [Miscanthus lutarioriparius]|uniref:Uncharacterized protein n=1 Tax=Miscanthus lutarioriparius TaxID=422564 RepID=A0A811R329_9POAL|nr:unnamed protein product [Miscanthus lutarioriparius]
MQLQLTNIAQCHPASTVQLQGQQIARPNGYQNQLLEQNVWDCVQHLLPTVQQEHFWITQQQVGMHMQRYQMLAANVGKMKTGYSGGWNNQQNAGWASGIQSPSKTVSPSAIVKSGTVPAALPSNSDSSFLLHNNTAVSGCKQATTTKLSTPLPPTDRAGDQEHGGAETPVAKTPAPPADQAERIRSMVELKHQWPRRQPHQLIKQRIRSMVLSSSPTAIRSSFNLMKSAVIDMDSVPLPIGSNNKMKRVYAVTSTSGSQTLSSTDDSTLTFQSNASDAASSGYHSGKRQKPQNVKDALLDDIEAVNSRLIDTLISITGEDGADRITLCNGTTLIKLSYTAVSLAPGLKSKFGVSGNFQPLVMPTTLSIPAGYPRSSPVIADDEGDARIRNKFSSISVAVDRAFRLPLHNVQVVEGNSQGVGLLCTSCSHRVCLPAGRGGHLLKSLPVSGLGQGMRIGEFICEEHSLICV